jgi:hypothetical protein
MAEASFEFTGPPSAIVVNSNTPTIPEIPRGTLGEYSSHTGRDKVTSSLRLESLPDNAEKSFENVPLFVIRGDLKVTEPEDTVYSLYYLNHELRQQAYYDEGLAGGNVPQNRLKRGSADYRPHAALTDEATGKATVHSVANAIRYVGYQIAATGNSSERTMGRYLTKGRRVTTQVQGRIDHVPNIFLPQGPPRDDGIQDGDLVGFAIKRVPFDGKLHNWRGADMSSYAKSGEQKYSCIQIVPIAGYHGQIPIGTTPASWGSLKDADGDTYDWVDVEGGDRAERFVPAIFIPVGRVTRTTPHKPSMRTQQKASYSYTDYEFMMTREQTCDLHLGIRHHYGWGV